MCKTRPASPLEWFLGQCSLAPPISCAHAPAAHMFRLTPLHHASLPTSHHHPGKERQPPRPLIPLFLLAVCQPHRRRRALVKRCCYATRRLAYIHHPCMSLPLPPTSTMDCLNSDASPPTGPVQLLGWEGGDLSQGVALHPGPYLCLCQLGQGSCFVAAACSSLSYGT